MATDLLGQPMSLVGSIYYDKPAGINWKVAWHQDLTLPFRREIQDPHFGPWTMKGGQLQAPAPAQVLRQTVILRIHLDPCRADTGGLKIISGSHAHGRLTAQEIMRLSEHSPFEFVEGPVASVLALNPLLVHGSSTAPNPSRRRVLSLQYAPQDLAETIGLGFIEQRHWAAAEKRSV